MYSETLVLMSLVCTLTYICLILSFCQNDERFSTLVLLSGSSITRGRLQSLTIRPLTRLFDLLPNRVGLASFSNVISFSAYLTEPFFKLLYSLYLRITSSFNSCSTSSLGDLLRSSSAACLLEAMNLLVSSSGGIYSSFSFW